MPTRSRIDGPKVVTIVDISREAGVSIKTVSRVINREEGVGAETRLRVEALVEQFGYRPNVSARSLSSRRSYLIGVIFMRVGAYHYVGEVQEPCEPAAGQAIILWSNRSRRPTPQAPAPSLMPEGGAVRRGDPHSAHLR